METTGNDAYIGGGYIVLARKIEEENSTFRYCKFHHQRWMFIKSLLRANFQDVVVNGIELKRGQFLTSIGEFARETHTTEKKVRGFWQKFSKLGFLALKRTNKYTIVTILNYDRYQRTENYLREKGQAKGQSKGKQRATDNKYNKDNKVNNTNVEAFFEYFLLKTKKNFKFTKDKIELIRKRLSEGFTLEQLKQAVDNFVQDHWEGRAEHLDLIYCIGKQRSKPDALEKWLNFTPKIALDGSREASKKTIITDSMLEEKFGRIATKDMIKKFLWEIPEQLWWKVDQFLRKRYPGSNGSTFAEAEREVSTELRANRENFTKLAQGIGK